MKESLTVFVAVKLAIQSKSTPAIAFLLDQKLCINALE